MRPMPSAQDIIQDALEDLGIYGPGDTISAADQDRSLFLLNSLLDEWAAQNLFAYTLNSTPMSLLAGMNRYTIGPGAQINVPRPDRITYGPGAASLVVTDVTGKVISTTPVDVVSAVEFQALQSYAAPTGLTDTMYYQPAYPLGIINVMPVPNVYGKITFAAWQRLPNFTDPYAEVVFAPGAQDAIRYNLAVYAKPYFTSSQLDPLIMGQAATTKGFLHYQSLNSRAMLNRFVLPSNPQKPG
jgi:hypothetical protein